MTGHCYVAAESLFHLLGGKAAGLKPTTIRHEGSVHWWLVDSEGEVLDLTADQFRTPVPYSEGRPRGFLTRDPSARALKVIRAVQAADDLA